MRIYCKCINAYIMQYLFLTLLTMLFCNIRNWIIDVRKLCLKYWIWGFEYRKTQCRRIFLTYFSYLWNKKYFEHIIRSRFYRKIVLGKRVIDVLSFTYADKNAYFVYLYAVVCFKVFNVLRHAISSMETAADACYAYIHDKWIFSVTKLKNVNLLHKVFLFIIKWKILLWSKILMNFSL